MSRFPYPTWTMDAEGVFHKTPSAFNVNREVKKAFVKHFFRLDLRH